MTLSQFLQASWPRRPVILVTSGKKVQKYLCESPMCPPDTWKERAILFARVLSAGNGPLAQLQKAVGSEGVADESAEVFCCRKGH
ncbi:uncharacterized protein SEPMUDRAFT_146308 [Sphaerulina musiva SO2202]|uniref:Uncharacterized protein n=1 Tax=Sphaerulina musiva (strain SO2202) TaxID=692275 RepID=N1QJ13_SPHMS|nr:uncharacterized protein SEPMUDRAFT_146308 [Sphaerulina musiva SO2202]EMF17211.1 hypothetical protein SEPMUDRAFT_146308 [Sphaerulina musiva SO2202]